MGLDRTGTFRIGLFDQPGVVASGTYTVDELRAFATDNRTTSYDQEKALNEVLDLYKLSELDVEDQSPEDVTTFDAGNRIALRVLAKKFRTSVRKNTNLTPQTIRNKALNDLITRFDELSVVDPGFLNLEESGLNPTIFGLLDASGAGLISIVDIQAGISQ